MLRTILLKCIKEVAMKISKTSQYEPDERSSLGLSTADLAKHKEVFGSTGSGMSHNVVMPLEHKMVARKGNRWGASKYDPKCKPNFRASARRL